MDDELRAFDECFLWLQNKDGKSIYFLGRKMLDLKSDFWEGRKIREKIDESSSWESLNDDKMYVSPDGERVVLSAFTEVDEFGRELGYVFYLPKSCSLDEGKKILKEYSSKLGLTLKDGFENDFVEKKKLFKIKILVKKILRISLNFLLVFVRALGIKSKKLLES